MKKKKKNILTNYSFKKVWKDAPFVSIISYAWGIIVNVGNSVVAVCCMISFKSYHACVL